MLTALFLLFLLFLIFFVLFQRGAPRFLKALFCFLGFFFGIWSLFFMVSDHYTGKGIDASVLFHLRYGLTAKIISMFKGLVLLLSGLVFLLSALAFLFYKKIPVEKGKPVHILLLFLFFGAFYIHPASKNFFDLGSLFLSMEPGMEKKMASFYAPPLFSSGAPEKAGRKNLVFIYLESLEQGFMDEALFPALTPGLKELGEEGFRFTNLSQLPNTDWTIAGIMASQCGMPAVFSLHPTSSNKALPGGTKCMGDLLAEKGYHLEYYGGASLDFAGKGNFLREHGFSSVKGFDELKDHLPRDFSSSDWGLYDDTLFELFYQRFLELLETGEPFGLFGLTLTTHAYPWILLPESCADTRYGDGKTRFLNACHCSDRLVYELVRKIQAADPSGNTLIVLASDHLAMQTESAALDKIDKKDRRNLLLVLGSDLPRGGENRKAGSTLDTGVTLMNLMGFPLEALHLGRNLLLEADTFVEIFPNATNALSLPFFRKLLAPPQLGSGIRISGEAREVLLDTQTLPIPLLLHLEKDARVKSFIVPESEERLFLPSPGGKNFFLWIDDYSTLKFLDQRPASNKKGLYLACGRLDSEVTLLPLGSGESVFSLEEILGFLRGKADPALSEQRLERMAAIRKEGDYFREEVDMLLGEGSLMLASKGGKKRGFAGMGTAEIRESGFALFGMDSDGIPRKLAHIDPQEPEKEENFPLIGKNFAETIKTYGNAFHTYILLLYDSGVSEKTDLDFLFKGLPLNAWRHLDARSPYIGVWTKDGAVYEKVGDPDTALLIHLRNFHDPGAATFSPKKFRSIFQMERGEDLRKEKFPDTDLLALELSLSRDGSLSFPPGIHEDDFEAWLRQNPEMRVIVSFPGKRLRGLALLGKSAAQNRERFIAEIRSPEEYHLVRLLGYENILWNLGDYRDPGEKTRGSVHRSAADIGTLTPREKEEGTEESHTDSGPYRNPEGRVAGRIKREGMDLFGLVVPEDRACTGLPAMLDIPVYLLAEEAFSREELDACGLDGQYVRLSDDRPE